MYHAKIQGLSVLRGHKIETKTKLYKLPQILSHQSQVFVLGVVRIVIFTAWPTQ